LQRFSPFLSQLGLSNLRPEDLTKFLQPEQQQAKHPDFSELLQRFSPFLSQLGLSNLRPEDLTKFLQPEQLQGLLQQFTRCPQQQQQQCSGGNVHRGVVCDGCEQSPIVGTRFHCQTCPDFDFCGKCHNEGNHKHDKTHSFSKLEVPSNRSNQSPNCWFSPFMDILRRQQQQQTEATTSGSSSSTQQQQPQKQTASSSGDQLIDEILCDDDIYEQPKQQQSEKKKEEKKPPTVQQQPQQSPQQQSVDYSQQLVDLQNMGFQDHTLNLYLLKKFQGNIQKVVGELLTSQ